MMNVEHNVMFFLCFFYTGQGYCLLLFQGDA